MKEGIAAVFGPITKIPRAHVQSICNAFEIPHLNAQWDARDSHDYFSISVYPDYNILSQAFADLINYWGWKRFTVIYEDDDGKIDYSVNDFVVIFSHTLFLCLFFKRIIKENVLSCIVITHVSA